MKKILKIITVCLVVLTFVLFTAEVFVWRIENQELQKDINFNDSVKEVGFHSGIKKINYEFENLGLKNGWGRTPEGLVYKRKKPIVLFGCSYAYGYGLSPKQTFAHKLSVRSRRSVYNRSFTSFSLQHFLAQAKSKALYEKIPQPEYVIYVYMHDHLRRLYLYSFAQWNILNEEFDLRYKEKNGELEEITNSNFLLNQIKRLYIANMLYHWYVEKAVINNPKQSYDFALKHFIAAKNEMSKHWKKSKFAVLIYDDFELCSDFKAQLEQNGFKVVDVRGLADNSKYMLKSNTPNEDAWNKIVPKVIKELKL